MTWVDTQARFLHPGSLIELPAVNDLPPARFVIVKISEESRQATRDDHVMHINAHAFGNNEDLYFLGPRKGDTVRVFQPDHTRSTTA